MTILEFRPRASADLEEAALWYESRRPGYGLKFLDEAESLISRIEDNPRQFPVAFRDARRALMNRFPYAIYFRLIGDRAIVVAVMGQARRESRWHSRV